VIHLSESAQEVSDVVAHTGKRPLELAESLGLFEGKIVAAHVVHATPDEIALLARRGVCVAHCPESNMKLGSGIAPVRAQLAAGLAVGLGTDGAASNDDLNLFEEIDTAAKLQKVAAQDPTALDGKTALAMATIIGARCLGLVDRIGSLEVGKEADVIAVGGDRAGLVPHGDIYGYLAYVVKGSDVRHVLVAGRVLLRDGKLTTIDAPAAEREVAAWRAKVDSQLAK
jgi:5-methylthioadenosine/S-adenosylhomocysteine deaminase